MIGREQNSVCVYVYIYIYKEAKPAGGQIDIVFNVCFKDRKFCRASHILCCALNPFLMLCFVINLCSDSPWIFVPKDGKKEKGKKKHESGL